MNNKGYFRFEKLEVWKDAREFVSLVYRITANFPSKERFGLVDQIRRAAVSIALNIAEGSINEVVTGFYISLDQRFISQKAFDQVYDFSLKLNARLNALIKSLSR